MKQTKQASPGGQRELLVEELKHGDLIQIRVGDKERRILIDQGDIRDLGIFHKKVSAHDGRTEVWVEEGCPSSSDPSMEAYWSM